ncbi:tyrosine-protein phosphatase [Virgibacillus dakarensis]|uniref:tyrosine-protein phosphatase n=1 Tax=Virgibacillus dakarensis TaxID=1917889 RepID=UPI000B446F6B|nr:CpsB/CapC family capsule biosynthesis tyrosine phosphatase [Virgibacillus dakarensis]
MIDIHCHILPGVDDGARTLTESLAMAHEAASQGIQKIIATPHHHNGSFDNPGQDVIGAVEYLNWKFQEEQIPVEIVPGQEPRINGDVVEDLKRGDILPLNVTSGYVFIELPSSHVPQYTTQLLFDVQIAGYKPIIVHPERNHELMDNPDKLYRMVKNGALTQITAASVVGKNGGKVQKFTNQLVEANLTHFVASDAHNVKKRGFYMQDAFEQIKKQFGNMMQYQFMENSEALIVGKPIHADEPERIKAKKLWGLLRK